MSVSVIVALAGQGKRMKTNVPKQFIELFNKPLFIYTLEEIEQCECVDEIVLVTGKEHLEYLKTTVERYHLRKVKKIIEGGAERQDSIYNGIMAVNPNNSYIAVQDGVRPLVKSNYFAKSVELLEKNRTVDGVVVGVWAKDTIKMVNADGLIESTPDRKTIFHAQTPQTFRVDVLKKAYQVAKETHYLGTDDASLVERYKGNVMILEGDYENIKVTTPSDLDFFRHYVEVRDESKN